MHARLLQHEFAHARVLFGALAACLAFVGCAAPEAVDTKSEGGAAEAHEQTREALANKPKLAEEKVTRQAGAFKRASQEEVRAFLARRNAENPAISKTAAELDGLIAEATSSDPGRRRVGLRGLHDAVRTMPTLEERRSVGARLRAAQLDAVRNLGPAALKGAQP